MSFLQTLKEALQSKIGQAVVSGIPEVVTAGAEIAANPNQAIEVLASLVETELAQMSQTIADNHNATSSAVAQIAEALPATVADAVSQAAGTTPAVPAGTVSLDSETLAKVVEQVLTALNPKLAQYDPIIEIVAQHFPHLKPAQ
jgi:hypothetical protein